MKIESLGIPFGRPVLAVNHSLSPWDHYLSLWPYWSLLFGETRDWDVDWPLSCHVQPRVLLT